MGAAAGRPGIEAAYTATTTALVAVITELSAQIKNLQGQVEACFGQHPDAEIYLSQPGLGALLGARVLAEFGDDPNRYTDARARKNYSRMSPITRASGKKQIVIARYARNRRLGDALLLQTFAALNASPGARGATHYQALRAVANRLVGILHVCLRNHAPTTRPTPGTPPPRAAKPSLLDTLAPWDVLTASWPRFLRRTRAPL